MMKRANSVHGLCWLLMMCASASLRGQDARPAQDAGSGQVSSGQVGSGQVGSGQAAPETSVLPGRVVRLTFVAGDVKVERADNTGEEGAVLNMPLREGTRLLCGAEDGRIEIEFEDGSLVRLTPGSGLLLDSLTSSGDVARTHMTLLSGMAYFELRSAREFDYLVEANGLRLSPVENAAFRVRLAPDTPAAVAVLSGTARVESPEHFHVDVRMGESLRADAADAARYFLDSTYTEESWDWWNEERDQAASDEAAHATSARSAVAGSQGYGWADLDANGTWYDVPGLGMVWQPEAADSSFDPYGFGDWVFDSGQYVFTSGYAWGWTPFRCGRWDYWSGFGWGWTGSPECGRWGYGGRHGITLGSVPPHYHRPEPPPLGGHIHRTVLVRGPDGPRPPILVRDGPASFNGRRVEALPPVGTAYTPQGGSAVGRGLLRDFPLDHTHQAVLGVEAGSLRGTPLAPGWHEGRAHGTHQAADAGVSAAGAGRRSPVQGTVQGAAENQERGTGEAPARTGRPVGNAGDGAQTPARRGDAVGTSRELGGSERSRGSQDSNDPEGLHGGRPGTAVGGAGSAPAGSATDPSRAEPVPSPSGQRAPLPAPSALEPRRAEPSQAPVRGAPAAPAAIPAPVRVAPAPTPAPAAPGPAAPAHVEPPRPK